MMLVACSSPKNSDQSQFSWQITVKGSRTETVLTDQVTVTNYDGTSQIVTQTDKPSTGKVYVLLHLSIRKAQAGGSAFSWSKLTLKDANDQTYQRLNDDFLNQHNFDRLQGIDLVLGDHDGWIAFEVDAKTATKTLTLIYAADEGENRIYIKP
jgi:hypothetical protein